ncbi:MAG: hypothetical protein ACOX6J_07240 [Oscillospiraceae bacterium]
MFSPEVFIHKVSTVTCTEEDASSVLSEAADSSEDAEASDEEPEVSTGESDVSSEDPVTVSSEAAESVLSWDTATSSVLSAEYDVSALPVSSASAVIPKGSILRLTANTINNDKARFFMLTFHPFIPKSNKYYINIRRTGNHWHIDEFGRGMGESLWNCGGKRVLGDPAYFLHS